MHIKRVTIRGFKTYRTETVIEDFSSHANLILGKNGSGKSNLLDAIQFVLTDKYHKITGEAREKLLHEGAGHKVAQADVEIVFDNEDKRLPVEPPKGQKDNTEVRIRRTIGLKKDQYLVNDAPYSVDDFRHLLESAGMTRTDPYYIVQQGRIASLMKQTKAERLNLLKEIAGTSTYDDRKKESLKIMKETDHRLAQIEKVIDTLETRLRELEEESAEFKKFHTLDTTRRSLEYSIYEHERESATSKLEAIDKKRASGSGHAEEQGSAYTAAAQAVTAAEEEVERLRAAIKKGAAAKATVTAQETTLLKRRTELELGCKDLRDKLTGARGSKDEAASELKTLQKKLKEAHAKLEARTAEYAKVAAEEEKLATHHQRLDQRLADLASKRDRSAKFTSRKERDADLKKQLTRVAKEKADLSRQVDKTQQLIRDAQSNVEKSAAEVAKKEAQVQSNRDAGDKINTQIEALTAKRDLGLNARKAAWKKSSELEGEHAELKATTEKARRNLQTTMDKDLYRGLEGVKLIASELKLAGVFGPLIELFECNVEFHQCVEITAGNSLFHVVVDNEVTATRVVKELLARKLGRVTFIPLSRINPHRPEYPSSNDAMPMLSHLRFEAKYEKAMVQVFGKTLIARDLTVAAHMAMAHDLNTITLSGDRVDKKGALTGGFSDLSERGRSRLAAQADIAAHAARFEEVTSELESVKVDLRTFDDQVAKVMSDIAKQQESKASLRSQVTQWTQEIKQAKAELQLNTDIMARNEKLLPPLRASLASAETQIESLESEAASEFRSALSAEEEAELKRITAELEVSRRSLKTIRSQKSEVEGAKNALESLLSANLNRREEELNTRLNTATQEEDSEVLQRDEQELAQLNQQIKELEAEIKASEAEMEKATKESRDLQNNLEKLRTAASDAHALLSEDAKAMDKLLSQRLMYAQKKDDAVKKIRDLGALPNEAFEKYKDMSAKQLFERLEKTQASLKKFSGVNRKAVDQYTSFTEQRTELMERKKELDSGRVAIMELIEHLDAKKDEAIERTFKTIAKHFSEVFSELVPGGKATLVIETRKLDGENTDEESEAEEEAEEEEEEEEKGERKSRSSKRKSKAPAKKKAKHAEAVLTTAYTGIAIKVSFTGVASHTHQLSGGQESVVALSLIFAIQRCDPSPFYLLDEIDSALDPVHRTAVTNMLKEQSATTQFICTTFHPEMLAAADKMFGVVFKNKASQVRVIEHAEAMKLIQVSEREAEQE